jgi:DNA invertase Pin-like site-specific DNA recombinase
MLVTKVRAAVYIRVSTTHQNSDNQLHELERVAAARDWQIVATYRDDGISGAKGRDGRPALDALLKAATRREFDLIAVWSIDRLGRSLQHLVTTVNDLHAQGVQLYFHQQAIDTTTPSGKLMFGVFSSFAEFERELIRERIKLGVERARKEGKKLGRPSSVTESTRAAIVELYKKGMSPKKISQTLRCGVGTAFHTLKQRGLLAA